MPGKKTHLHPCAQESRANPPRARRSQGPPPKKLRCCARRGRSCLLGRLPNKTKQQLRRSQVRRRSQTTATARNTLFMAFVEPQPSRLRPARPTPIGRRVRAPSAVVGHDEARGWRRRRTRRRRWRRARASPASHRSGLPRRPGHRSSGGTARRGWTRQRAGSTRQGRRRGAAGRRRGHGRRHRSHWCRRRSRHRRTRRRRTQLDDSLSGSKRRVVRVRRDCERLRQGPVMRLVQVANQKVLHHAKTAHLQLPLQMTPSHAAEQINQGRHRQRGRGNRSRRKMLGQPGHHLLGLSRRRGSQRRRVRRRHGDAKKGTRGRNRQGEGAGRPTARQTQDPNRAVHLRKKSTM